MNIPLLPKSFANRDEAARLLKAISAAAQIHANRMEPMNRVRNVDLRPWDGKSVKFVKPQDGA